MTSPPKNHWFQRNHRRLLAIGFIMLAMMLFIIIMLPVWIQSPQGRLYALKRLNVGQPFQLNVEDWSLGWLSKTQLRKLTIRNQEGSLLIQADHLTTDLSLWDYFRGHWDFGLTTAEGLQLTIGPTHSFSLSEIIDTIPINLRGSLTAQEGQIHLQSQLHENEESINLSGLHIQVPIASNNTPIHIRVTNEKPHAREAIPFSLNLTLPPIISWKTEEPDILTPGLESVGIDLDVENPPLDPLASWLGLKAGWSESFGPVIETVQMRNTPAAHSQVSNLVISVVTKKNQGVDLKGVLVRNVGNHTSLQIQPSNGHAIVRGRLAGPFKKCAGYVHPLLKDTQAMPEAMIRLDALQMPLAAPHLVRADGTLMIRDFTFENPTLLPQLIPAIASNKVAVILPTLRFTLEQQRVTCSNFTLSSSIFPSSSPFSFLRSSGYVEFSGAVHLYITPLSSATSSATPTTLSSGSVTIPMTGTLTAPKVN